MSPARQLQALPTPGVAPGGARIPFCSHCGKPPEGGVAPEVGSRVCTKCNLGLVVEAPESVAPKANDAFLIVDKSLAVHAVSRRAEKLLGLREVDAVDRHVTDLLVPADAEAQGPHVLSALLVAAAAGAEDAEGVVLRPVDEFGVRFQARIGPCGPAPGALVVLDLG
jgi:PAS domain-containing protein